MACASGKGRFNLSSKNDWEQICHEVQERLLITPLEVKSAKLLRSEFLKCLIAAWDDGFLETESHEIHDLLKMTKENKGIIEITGGGKNQKRLREIPHFKRFDGCWLIKKLNLLKLSHLILKSDFQRITQLNFYALI
jgi:hypothetical protein